ncbi:hypothetical protein AB9F26_02095 [Falsihalocynthiibacter sp. BN13B15]|uniref:hypothetical protein n=1 Tax=Falsihalocynthiibacter sp. BN13B15 TaxID=3240871 RepID=UPI0035108FED
MKQINSILLFTILFAATIVFSGLTLAKGGMYLGKHESDILHLLDILQRLRLGGEIHTDIQTPIGVFAFAPVLWVANFDVGFGMSFAIVQLGLALCLLPALVWIGVSRLGPVGAVFFGVSILAIATSMVGGQTDTSSSISVHYNRWAWALALTGLALAVLMPRIPSPRASMFEGAVIGVIMAVLALLKVTFFLGFAIPVVVGLLLHKNKKGLGVAILAGLGVVAATTLMMGATFWGAYFDDLMRVATSKNRPFPGESLMTLVTAPQYLATSIVAFIACVTLRQSGQGKAALLLLICLPGFYYITFQNFGNDPIWLIFLMAFLMANRPDRDLRNGMGWSMRGVAAIMSGAALAIVAPVYLNILTSSLHHYAVNTASYAPFLPIVAADIQTANIRSQSVSTLQRVDGGASGLEGFVSEPLEREPRMLGGIVFPECQNQTGVVATVHAISGAISQIIPAKGGALYVADVISAHWIEAGMTPAKGSAPWYYGGLPGFENAEFLLVPKCPALLSVRNAMLAEIQAHEKVLLTPLDETPLYGFFRIDVLDVEKSSKYEVEREQKS